jgi:hypothetical protein
MGVADTWYVVEPMPGALGGSVVIRNPEQRLAAYVRISPVDAQFLNDYEILKRIQLAMVSATLHHSP